MDWGKGGQTLSLQEREGENRKQSAKLGRNEKEKKKRDQPGQGDSGQEGHGKGAGEGGGMGRPSTTSGQTYQVVKPFVHLSRDQTYQFGGAEPTGDAGPGLRRASAAGGGASELINLTTREVHNRFDHLIGLTGAGGGASRPCGGMSPTRTPTAPTQQTGRR